MAKCQNIANSLPDSLFDSDEKQDLFAQLQGLANTDGGRENLEKIKDQIIKDKQDLVSKQKRNNYITLIKAADAESRVLSFKRSLDGMKAILVGQMRKVRDAGRSIDLNKKTFRNQYASELINRLNQEGLFQYFMDKTNDDDIAHALPNENLARNEKSRKVAQIANRIYKDQRTALNNRGADIEELPDFIAHQTHDVEKLLQSSNSLKSRLARRAALMAQFKNDAVKVREVLHNEAYKRWSNFIRPLLDTDRTFKDKDIDTGLKAVYNTLTRGKDLDDMTVRASTGTNAVSRLGAKRVLHFKDGESWSQYNKMYGSGSVKQAVIDTICNHGERIGLIDMTGPDPSAWYNTLKSRIAQKSPQADVQSDLRKADHFFDYVTNKHAIPVNQTFANTMMGIRSAISLSKLGGVFWNSVPDSVQGLATLQSNGVNLLSRWGALTRNLTDTLTLGATRDKNQLALANALGVTCDSAMGQMASRFTSIDSPKGMLGKTMHTFFKLNLMESWDKNLRSMVATTLSRTLANLKDVSYDGLDQGLKNNLLRYGIEQKEWDLIRSNNEAMKNYNGQLFVAPDMVRDFTPESLNQYAGENLSDRGRQALIEDMENRLRSYFIDETDLSQIQGRAIDRAWAMGTPAGTVKGEVMRSLAQFKSYMIGVTRVMAGRWFLENADSNVTNNFWSGKVNGRMIAESVIAASVFGYLGNAMRSFFSNGTIPDPLDKKTVLDAFISGGGAGIYGEYLTANYNSYGQDLLSKVAGPTGDLLDQTAKLYSSLTNVSNVGHRLPYKIRATKALLSYMKENAPFANLFYAKRALDNVVNKGVMEKIDPGYTHRLQQLSNKQTQGNINIF